MDIVEVLSLVCFILDKDEDDVYELRLNCPIYVITNT